jgi:hypothetical protein
VQGSELKTLLWQFSAGATWIGHLSFLSLFPHLYSGNLIITSQGFRMVLYKIKSLAYKSKRGAHTGMY